MSQLASTIARYLPAHRPVWISAEYTALASGTTWLASARRVAVFVDVENIRHGIKDGRRRYRGLADRTGNCGIIATALLLNEMSLRRSLNEGEPPRVHILVAIHAFQGTLSQERQPEKAAADLRRTQKWEEFGATVFTRTMHYYKQAADKKWWKLCLPAGKKRWVAREKGIDVGLAVTLVWMAMADEADVFIVASTDTDLLPALDLVAALPGKQVETAGVFRRLALVLNLPAGSQAARHQLGHKHFDRIRDDTDHTASDD